MWWAWVVLASGLISCDYHDFGASVPETVASGCLLAGGVCARRRESFVCAAPSSMRRCVTHPYFHSCRRTGLWSRCVAVCLLLFPAHPLFSAAAGSPAAARAPCASRSGNRECILCGTVTKLPATGVGAGRRHVSGWICPRRRD